MKKIASFFKNIYERINDYFVSLLNFFKTSNINVKASLCLMGLGQLMYHQYGKGIMYLLIEIAAVLFFAIIGFQWIVGFFTLGTVEADPWTGKEGDNSVIFLLLGIFAIILLILLVVMYISNVKDSYKTSQLVLDNKKIPKFKDELKDLLDKKFYKSVLFLPIIGAAIFSVLPIVFMILIAFTNYGEPILPPLLIDWVGFDNFVKIFSLSDIGPTFFKILGRNILWAICSTLFNYFLGLFLALLLNKKIVRGKAFWRLFPILAYAIPGFITLTAFKFLFSLGGPINQAIEASGGSAIAFLEKDGTWYARIIGLLVNGWLTIPSVMLLATGILSNINNETYEAARIDGANVFQVFVRVALPLCIPSLATLSITTFMESWNDYLWPLLMLSDKNKMTLPIALSTLNGQYATEYNVLMAGSLISMIPIIIIYVIAQKQFKYGMMAGGIKG